MKIFSEVRSLPEFEKDLKKLRKRFESLDGDLDTFIQSELGQNPQFGTPKWLFKPVSLRE